MFSPNYDFILLIYKEFLNGTFCMKWPYTPIAVRKIGSRYYRIKMFVEEVPSDEYKGMDGVVNYVKNDPQDRRVNKFRFAGNDRRENAASIRKQTLKR